MYFLSNCVCNDCVYCNYYKQNDRLNPTKIKFIYTLLKKLELKKGHKLKIDNIKNASEYNELYYHLKCKPIKNKKILN